MFFFTINCLKKKEKEKEKINNVANIDINHFNAKDIKPENNEIKEKSFLEEYLKIVEEKCEKNKEADGNLEKLCFFFFSILSSIAIVGINRGIFISFHNISTKNIFYPIIYVYAGSFVLSLLFYFFYSIPKLNQKIKLNIKENIGNNTENQKEKEKEDEKNNNQEFNNNMHVQINEKNDIKSEEIRLKKETLYKKLKVDSDLDTNNENERDIKNKIENIEEIKQKEDNSINNNKGNKEFRKACTCFGYIYFSKKIENKDICICYKYDSCCSWLCSKIIKPGIFFPLLIEIYIQFSSVGYYSVISDKLLEEYSFSKIKKFLVFLFFLYFFYTFFILIAHSCYSANILVFKIFGNYNNNYENNLYLRKCNIATIFFYNLLILTFSFCICIISIKYLRNDNHPESDWDSKLQTGVIISKFLDLQMLSFFDFFDDEDCLNTSLFITVEKVIWMIIEVIFDIKEIKDKTLFIIQISVSGLFFIISIFVLICFCIDIKQAVKS